MAHALRYLALAALLSGCTPLPGSGENPPGADAGGADAAAADADPTTSQCTVGPEAVSCPYDTLPLHVSELVTRDVHYQVPLGAPPADGWPVAVLFQGSLYTAELFFEATIDLPHGAYYQGLAVKLLLDNGYAVVAPEAHLDGSLFWDTNVPPWSLAWEGSPDDVLMRALFDAIDTGDFGPLDGTRLYAAGISSGGYMTSRMAVSYPGRFSALAIHSGSYATCSGTLCVVPTTLPATHPPTLFLHGDDDLVVPSWTMELYRDRLLASGRVASSLVRPDAGHEWIPEAPDAILDWFDAWP